ncbi:hypothetical protein JCM1840_004834 [Sporobolomyces johnsonii]
MPLEPNETRYALLLSRWPRGRDFVTVSYSPGQLDLRLKLPVAFVVRSNQNNHGFVQDIAQILVDEPGSLRQAGALGVELDRDEAPVAGEYVFVPDIPETVFTESRGPESKRSGMFAAPAEPSPPMSGSSHSSCTTLLFREALLGRDGLCYFSEASALECIATHIVPETRPDVYAEITGDPYQYLSSAGILLDRDLHKPYNDYAWSLYCKDDTYHFIAFDARHPSLAERHGQSFTTALMRREDPPDPALCAWHFRQCVQKAVRGYSVGMAINAL